MVEFIKTCDQYPCKFNFGHIFSSIVSPSLLGKNRFSKHCKEEMGNLLVTGVMMIKTWGRVLLGGSNQIQFFDSQMYFLVILTP